MEENLVNIDGSVLEGGGQILRIAVCISCLKRIPIRIFNIRLKRSKPGLKEQHLKGIQLVQEMSKAKVEGAFIGSTELSFYPGIIVGGSFKAVVKTAGSIALLLQISLPCALFAQADVTLHLFGGTNAEMAPQIDYMTEVFRPIMEKFGVTFHFDLVRRGYFPRGGGEVVVNVTPVKQLTGVQMTNPGKVTSISGWSFVAGKVHPHLASRMADSAQQCLSTVCRNINIQRYKESYRIAPDNASGIILAAHTDTNCILGADALGNPAEDIDITGKRAAEALISTIEQKCCVDEHSQNQIIIFMALASGPSSVLVGDITLHTKTAIHVIETLTTVKFNIENLNENRSIIHCTGSR